MGKQDGHPKKELLKQHRAPDVILHAAGYATRRWATVPTLRVVPYATICMHTHGSNNARGDAAEESQYYSFQNQHCTTWDDDSWGMFTNKVFPATRPQIFKVDTLVQQWKITKEQHSRQKLVFYHQALDAKKALIPYYSNTCSDTIRKKPFSNFWKAAMLNSTPERRGSSLLPGRRHKPLLSASNRWLNRPQHPVSAIREGV